ncbi:MAG: DEAD/DEAH box helicase family protein [Candidatus Nanopelagicales bacterium]
MQADSRAELKEMLAGRRVRAASTSRTIQKFGLSKEDRDAGRSFPLLSDRSNIVVIVDEAHRSNYDFIDGFARNVRDALPNASFIGFTGTPIESKDKSTTASLRGLHLRVRPHPGRRRRRDGEGVLRAAAGTSGTARRHPHRRG